MPSVQLSLGARRAVTFFLMGLGGGFVAGLLGIGGGIIMVPLLAYVGGLSFHGATAISLVQIMAGAASGVYRHFHLGSVAPRVALVTGLASAATASLTSVLSPSIPAVYLQVVFFLLLTTSAVTLLVPTIEPPPGEVAKPSLPAAIGLGLAAGAVTGTLGAGGGFFMVPVMIYGFRLGTRVAIGTSLAVVLLGSIAGAVTKLVTNQIDPAVALPVVLGGVLGAQVGAAYCHRLAPRTLRGLLFGLLGVIALRTLAGILGLAS